MRYRIGAMMWLALSACSDGGRPSPPGEGAVPTATLGSAEARARGRGLFLKYCALCHGAAADGRGVRRTGLSSPPASFRSRVWRQTVSPRKVFAAIRDGKAGTSMPAWGYFAEQETWDLVAYVLSVSEAGP